MAQELGCIERIGLNSHQTVDTGEDAPHRGGATRSATAVAEAAVAATATLALSVTKHGGPVGTFVEVGSTGADSRVFNDHELDSGAAQMPLLRGNFYTVVWRGAFVAPGSATLHLRTTAADGRILAQMDKNVAHPPTNSPFFIPVM